jgi:hypothetical protein
VAPLWLFPPARTAVRRAVRRAVRTAVMLLDTRTQIHKPAAPVRASHQHPLTINQPARLPQAAHPGKRGSRRLATLPPQPANGSANTSSGMSTPFSRPPNILLGNGAAPRPNLPRTRALACPACPGVEPTPIRSQHAAHRVRITNGCNNSSQEGMNKGYGGEGVTTGV